MPKKKKLHETWTIRIVAGAITALWLGSTAWDTFDPAYEPPATIGLVFMAVLSTVLGLITVSYRDEKNKPEEKELTTEGSGESDE